MDTPLASAEHKKNADRNYSSVKKDTNNILNNPRDFELKKVNKKQIGLSLRWRCVCINLLVKL